MGSYNKAYQQLKQNPPQLNDNQDTNLYLEAYINAAIENYKGSKGGDNSISNTRQNSISYITGILNNEEDKTAQQLKQQIQSHFSSKAYRKTYADSSYLQDCVNAAFMLYEEQQLSEAILQNEADLKEQAVKLAISSLVSRGIIGEGARDNVINLAVQKGYMTNNPGNNDVPPFDLPTLLELLCSNYERVKDLYNKPISNQRKTDLENIKTIRGKLTSSEDSDYNAAQAISDLQNLNISQGLLKKQLDSTIKKYCAIEKALKNAVEKLDPYASYGTVTLTYTLQDVLLNAIEQYEGSKGGNISEERRNDIGTLRQMINGDGDNATFSDETDLETVNNNIKLVENYFRSKQFKPGIMYPSTLEKYCLVAMNDFAKNMNRQQNKTDNFNYNKHSVEVKTKTWEKPGNDSNKIILMVHGLADTVDTFNALARHYVEQDYKVISYDQAGHGFDSRRNHSKTVQIQQMQLDFHEFLKNIVKENPDKEIELLGHSTGGAILLNSYESINSLNNLKDNPPIKKIHLISPAAMRNSIFEKIASFLKAKGNDFDMNTAIKLHRSQGIGRKGGPTKVSSSFYRFMGNALKNLRRIFNNTDNTKIPVAVIYGKNDSIISKNNFSKIQDNNNCTIVSHEGGHNAHQEGSYQSGIVAHSLISPSPT